MASLKVQVYRGQVVPYRWFWRIVWDNGKTAATSNGVIHKDTAEAQAHTIAERLQVEVEVIQPCVI